MAQPSAACVRRSGAAAYANRKIHERKGKGPEKLRSGALCPPGPKAPEARRRFRCLPTKVEDPLDVWL